MHVQRQIDRLLDHRAAEWLELLKTGGSRERREFDRWLRQSPVHVEHLLEMAALEHALLGLSADQIEDVQSIVRRIQTQPVPARHLPFRASRWTTGSVRHREAKIAAAVAAVVVIGVTLLWAVKDDFWRRGAIHTMVGEQRSVTLADGSLVTLNTASQIHVGYSAKLREVQLDSGEAVFKVARDPVRPFEVHTHLATIRALATQFNVYERPQDTLISVLEGRVLVRVGHEAPQVLESGQEARLLPERGIIRLAHADVLKTLSWRQRRLSFDEAPLEEIVREFNRYNVAPKLRVEGVPRGRYQFGGIYDAGDPESLAQVLAREPGLRVTRSGNEIIIHPK